MKPEDEWKALLERFVPPGEMRDLLESVKVVPDEVASSVGYIICGERPHVPSMEVQCTSCGCTLFRSKRAPTAPKPICLSCVEKMCSS